MHHTSTHSSGTFKLVKFTIIWTFWWGQHRGKLYKLQLSQYKLTNNDYKISDTKHHCFVFIVMILICIICHSLELLIKCSSSCILPFQMYLMIRWYVAQSVAKNFKTRICQRNFSVLLLSKTMIELPTSKCIVFTSLILLDSFLFHFLIKKNWGKWFELPKIEVKFFLVLIGFLQIMFGAASFVTFSVYSWYSEMFQRN